MPGSEGHVEGHLFHHARIPGHGEGLVEVPQQGQSSGAWEPLQSAGLVRGLLGFRAFFKAPFST